jgi:hypothetical protein
VSVFLERFLERSDGQYAITGRAPSAGGQGDDIDLTAANGKKLLFVTAGAHYGFKAYWSPDSRHLVLIVPGREVRSQ